MLPVRTELGIALALIVALDVETFLATVLQLAVEHLILAEFARECTVVEGNLGGRTETNLCKAFFVITENPSVVTHKLLLETTADGGIEVEDVVRCDALAVRRIGDDDGFLAEHFALVYFVIFQLRLRIPFEFVEVLLLHIYNLADTCRTSIVGGNCHSLTIDVEAVNLVVEIALL